MKMNGFDNLKQQVLCLTPRRFGKTTSVAMFVAAYALSVPNSTNVFLVQVVELHRHY